MTTKYIDDGFAIIAREINFDTEAEAFSGDKDGREMGIFFEDAEGFEVFVFV